MPASTKNDVVIRDAEFFSGVIEVVEQYADDVATGTRGAIQYITESLKGDFDKQSFWELGSGLISDRDPTDISDVAVTGLSQADVVSPKCNLRIGPKQATIDQFKKLGDTPETMSFVIGSQLGAEMSTEWLNRGLAATVACLTKDATSHLNIYGESGADANINARALNKVLSKFGDRRERIVAWVCHSAALDDLTDGYILDKMDTVTSSVLYGGASPTLGRNVFVTDSPALIDDTLAGTTGTKYIILGLTAGALAMKESEDRVIELDKILGKGNIMRILQGEMAVNVSVKGYSYGGAVSPSQAALASSANWSRVYSDVKSTAGVALTVKAK